MIWLTWRQFRVQAASVYAGLAVIAVILVITGQDLAGRTDYSNLDVLYQGGLITLYLLPAVLGVFWGVPMVTRELETGTHALVWNQSVTRSRWLTTKLGIAVPAAMVAAGLLSLAVSWWAGPIDALASQTADSSLPSRISPVVFAARGLVPIGYAAFALVLGVTIAMVLRRTVAAMAVTLVALTAVQLAVPLLVRPNLLPATEQTVTISIDNVTQISGTQAGVIDYIAMAEPAGVWGLSNVTVDAAGNAVTPLPDTFQQCMPKPDRGEGPPSGQTLAKCFALLNDLGYRQHLVYQPGSRFWPLQWIETAILLALSGLLTWFCFRRLRHLS
ncbi:putative transmembrane transport protein [Alloactinosynnema sp. L-07]|uniref:transporter n=1 Tax=Alloactinosynnema sp. L-07 TaxID=1653480 RepID=UPI00065EFBBB|nr:transporter [Alloactinosynnema sp. L-07]CRK56097.1 putative transmembrane transport protein [Alloactinosynnema sp. L-07]